MTPLEDQEVKGLDLASLVQRMDDIILEGIRERYGHTHVAQPISLVSEIVNSKRVAAQAEDNKRRVAHIAFDYIVQMELHSIASGIANRILFTPEYDDKTSWRSPAFRMREGAIRQYQIVCSRMAMEIFMDLLHCIESGNRVASKRSKLKSFQKWLCNPNNEFHYFAHVLLEAYRFDRGLRTPEVHGTPRLPKKLLRLQNPSIEEMNDPLRLVNALMACWKPLLIILDGNRPEFMQISEGERDWFATYMSGTKSEVATKLEEMFDGIE